MEFENTILPGKLLSGGQRGGRVFDLMTEWEDLFTAVSLVWQVPSSAAAPGPSQLPGPDSYFAALRYAFERYRAGVVVSIRDSRLVLFLPFANDRGYRNSMKDWTVPRAYAEYKLIEQDTRGSVEPIIKDPTRWWFNGHLVCNVRPGNIWGEYQLPELFTMITESLGLIHSTTPIAADFILNKRDCPLWFKSVDSPPLFHLPVLSPYTSCRVHDLPMVLADDWRLSLEGLPAIVPWEDRKDSRALFRGSSTGKGITPETNVRMALCLFALKFPVLLDCKITKINDRDQLVEGEDAGKVRVAAPKVRELQGILPMAPFMNFEDQTRRYKLAIYIRGHQAASRLGALLRSGFCVIYLNQEDEHWDAPGCDPWFKHLLVDEPGWKAGKLVAGDVESVIPDKASSRILAIFGKEPSRKRGRMQISKFLNTESPVPSVRLHARDSAATCASGNVCFVKTFEEMVECVRFLQINDGFARRISENAALLSRTKIHNRDFLLEFVHGQIRRCKVDFSDSTHPLFGASNFGTMVASTRLYAR